jgi:two-component system sensor histidine kinase UhpB
MDLRRQLVAWLGASLLGLILMTVTINLASLRSDVAAEVAASERLALALLEAGRIGAVASDQEAAARLAGILDRGALRHIAISMEGVQAPPPESAGTRLAGWLAHRLNFAPGAGHAVQVGGQILRIAPNPASEIDERLADIVQLWSTLLFFSGATLLVAWFAADRALRPVRALEAGLQRLAAGAPDAALPPFALREFSRVAKAIDHLAATLSAAQLGQRQLSHQLLRVQEDERRTLAMELHDEVGQTLTAISLTAAYLGRHATELDGAKIDECARDLRRDVRACSEQLRAMLSRLRPHSLEGARAALGQDASLVLYRVVQEALTNVVRHSGAARCLVELAVEGPNLAVRIDDDGCGLPPAGMVRGCGLTGMAERLRMVGGTLRIEAGGSRGVHLLATLPLASTNVQKEEAWEPMLQV